jgi:hypothetical protein
MFWNLVGYSERSQPNWALHQVFRTLSGAVGFKNPQDPTMSTPPTDRHIHLLGARITATGWLGVAAAFVLGCGLILAFLLGVPPAESPPTAIDS